MEVKYRRVLSGIFGFDSCSILAVQNIPPTRWLGEYLLANNPNKPKVADVDDKLLVEEPEEAVEGEGGRGGCGIDRGQLQQ